jgi:hypothetical protein
MRSVRSCRLFTYLFVLVPVLAGCGGGGGPAAPQSPAQPTLPQISAQPQDVTADEGGSANFSVVATGANLTYQWRRNGAIIPGATQSSYALSGLAAADHDSRISVVVTGAGGSVESRQAVLTVRTRPSISGQPENRSVLSGVPAVYTVTAAGTSPTYQWFRDGAAIPGANEPRYAVGVPLAGDHGASFTVTVTNALGSVTSTAGTLSVNSGGPVRPSSHANAKGRNVGPVAVPRHYNARGFGDFFGNGAPDYFVATLNYDPQLPQSQAQAGQFQFWRWTGSAYVHEAARLDDPTGCIHPRKAVIADFNGDQRPDVFVVCHGYDAPPFPGEPNYVLLSQPSGVYRRVAAAGGDIGFFHSAAALDINNDGHMDLVVTDTRRARSVFALINNGQGVFTPRDDLFPIGRANYFTVEAADVDGDGRPDVVAGGHDWENAPTVLLLNNGSGSFAGVTPRTIPAVPNEGVVLDFVVFDADRNGRNEIYVVRTSGGDGTFYQSRTVQRVEWPTLAATVIHSQRGAPWIDFLFPHFSGGRYSLVSDNTTIPFQLGLF